MSFATPAQVKEYSGHEKVLAKSDTQLEFLIAKWEGYVKAKCHRTFAEIDEDEQMRTDLRNLTCALVERDILAEDVKMVMAQNFQSEKISDYQYSKRDDGLTGDPYIDELIAAYRVKPTRGFPCDIVLSGPTRKEESEG